MNTLQRINKLLLASDLPGIRAKDLQLESRLTGDNNRVYVSTTPVHDIIDRIDRANSIITRFLYNGNLAPVGNRLARLERHVKSREHPPFFWLGADTGALGVNLSG